jgi:hypothetical protein
VQPSTVRQAVGAPIAVLARQEKLVTLDRGFVALLFSSCTPLAARQQQMVGEISGLLGKSWRLARSRP